MKTEDVRKTLLDLRTCALAWEPGVRLLGNIRAQDIAEACAEAVKIEDDRDYYRSRCLALEQDNRNRIAAIDLRPVAPIRGARRWFAWLFP